MVGKGPQRPEPPASAIGRGGSIIPAQPLRKALLDRMQTAATGASSTAGRGWGGRRKLVEVEVAAGDVGRLLRLTRRHPPADSPDHRIAPSEVDPSRTLVHQPPVADPPLPPDLGR